MPLTKVACDAAQPREKPWRMADGGGLYLEVTPTGAKYWRLKYRYLGREKRLALGVYPRVMPAEARNMREEAKRVLAEGGDPGEAKKQAKRKARLEAANTFEAVAREWHAKQGRSWGEKTQRKVLRYLEMDIFPRIGARPIATIEPPELLDALRPIEARGAHYTATRVKQVCGQVFRYAVATGRCPRDPSADLKGALTPHKPGHYAALTIQEVPDFLAVLERNDARLFSQTRRGLTLLMLTLARTSELICATWDEVNWGKAQWEIPAARMKMGRPHVVPLSRQALALLQDQRAEVGHLNTPLIFPSRGDPRRPMSNNTLLFAIRRLGYGGRMTGHGFRALAMTTLMEDLGYPFEIPDAQLAHAKGTGTRRAYDRTQYLPQRMEMMQRWADYLDTPSLHIPRMAQPDSAGRRIFPPPYPTLGPSSAARRSRMGRFGAITARVTSRAP